jgi:deazaflavin-dependent oxidoreductase (nitroreductase family)
MEVGMFTLVVAIAGVLVVGLATLGIVFVLGMRAKSPLALGAGIWFTRTVANPLQMKSAGRPGADAAVIRHRGRKSGRAYETPVGVVPAGDGFLIALPYSSRANWLRNVLASGSATIVHEGQTYAVDRPKVVPMRDVATCFTASDRRSFRLFRVNECLRVRKAEPVAPSLSSLRAV